MQPSNYLAILRILFFTLVFGLWSLVFGLNPALAICTSQNTTIACTPPCEKTNIKMVGQIEFHDCVEPSAPPSSAGSTTSVTGTSLGKIGGLGPLGIIIQSLGPNNIAPASSKLAWAISAIVGIITIVAGIWFMIKLLIAGFNIISSSGDKNKMQEAQHAITNSIIGITVVVAAYALTSLFGKILGIPEILNIGAFIESIGPK